MTSPWDAGKRVAARGRFYVQCGANATTQLRENTQPAGTGAAGDELDWLWMDAGAGNLQLFDGPTLFRAWAGQTTERFIPLNVRSLNGGWSVTMPAGITATAAGSFS